MVEVGAPVLRKVCKEVKNFNGELWTLLDDMKQTVRAEDGAGLAAPQVGVDIRAVAEVCHKYGTALKVILETDALDAQQIAEATRVAVAAGADFVKSSTGFYTGGPCVGATEEVVAIMLENAEGKAKIKGSGCIRTREHFLKLIDMGIDRMGIGYKPTPVVLGISSK